jgi:hypothetical protein
MPDVARLSRRQAEKVAGVSRATLARYVADGRLSAGKDGSGHNVYDAAELRRVFPDSFDLRRLDEMGETDETPVSETPVSPPETGWQATRLAVLEVEKRHLEGDRDRLREEAERLRRELGEERGRRESERAEFMGLLRQKEETVRLLTDRRQQQAEQARRDAEAAAAAKPRGFWARVFGSA